MPAVLFLALFLVPFGWLVPLSVPPWVSWQSEALSVFSALILLLWAVWHIELPSLSGCTFRRDVQRISFEFVTFFIILLVFTAINSGGSFTDLIFGAIYLVLPALLVLFLGAGRIVHKFPITPVAFYLGVVVAGALTVYTQLVQWFGWAASTGSLWYFVMPAPPAGRAAGNLFQANLTATAILLSMIALACLLRECRRVTESGARLVLGASACFFGIALGATHSRTGLLALLVVNLYILIVWYRNRSLLRELVAFFAMLTIALLSVFYLEDLARLLLLSNGGRSLSDMQTAQIRLDLWVSAIDMLVSEGYWFYGGGLNSFQLLYLLHINYFSDLSGMLFGHAHNIIIDLMIWFGIVPGMVISCIAGWFMVKILNQGLKSGGGGAIASAFLLPLGIHAMLEFPLHYAFFLLPASIWLGICIARLQIDFSVKKKAENQFLSRLLAFFLVGAISFCGIVLARDTVVLENNFRVVRYDRSGLEVPYGETLQEFVVLDKWEDWQKIALMDKKQLCTALRQGAASITRDVLVYPNPRLLLDFAYCSKQEGDSTAANMWLDRVCAVTKQNGCESAKAYLSEAM